jgi:cytochrome c-type biogenesis protein CcmH
MSWTRLVLLLLAAMLAMPAPASAQSPRNEVELEAMVRSLASQLRCPVCQGVSIQDSPTELAFEMKDVIRQQLREGKSPEQVKDFFVERYGEWVLLQPKPQGFNLLVYFLPLVMLLAGGWVVYSTVQKWSRPGPADPRFARGGAPGEPGRPEER